MKNRKKIHNNWETPEWLLNDIKKEFGNFFDPCPLNSKFDGLSIEWKKVNYINPPYSLIEKEAFIKKAIEESKKGKVCIMLLPSATDTKSFHKYIWNKEKHKAREGVELRFFEGRISFKGYKSNGEYTTKGKGQSGSMLVIFRL